MKMERTEVSRLMSAIPSEPWSPPNEIDELVKSNREPMGPSWSSWSCRHHRDGRARPRGLVRGDL